LSVSSRETPIKTQSPRPMELITLSSTKTPQNQSITQWWFNVWFLTRKRLSWCCIAWIYIFIYL